MASYTERVVRSLSADELEQSPAGRRDVEALLRRAAGPPPGYAGQTPAAAQPAPATRERRGGGLLKRLRAAFRPGAGTAGSRPGRFDKGAIRPTIDILPEDHLAALGGPARTPGAYPPYPAPAAAAGRPSTFTSPAPPPGAPLGSRYAPPPSAFPPPAGAGAPAAAAPAKRPGGRVRSWRPGRSQGDSARNLALNRERDAPGRAFTGDARRRGGGAGRANGGAAGQHLSQGDLGGAGRGQNPPPDAPPPRRSLPKRVFSSPPSLSARSFVFGSRKRSSATAKPGRGRSASALAEGPQLSGQLGAGTAAQSPADQRKLSRSFGGRQGGVASFTRGGSMTLNSVGGGLSATKEYIAPEHNAEAFRFVVEAAVEGKASFSALLDAMFRLQERLPPETKDVLITYLSRQDNIEALIDRLTVVLPILADDDGVEGPTGHSGQRVRYRHSYVSSMLLSNGPMALRRVVFSSAHHLDRLVGILQDGSPSDPVLVRSVCKVLLSVLRDSPNDTVAAMQRRRGFLPVLLSHIAVTGCPEVCLSMLSTVRCQQELKFGPPNRPVVCMMADAKLLPTLCDKLAAAAEAAPLTSVASATIENCSRVIVGIALRALVIQRHEINDVDDSDTTYMVKFNQDLASLDVFNQPMPILRVLDSGFAAMSSHDKRGYALATALTAVRYMLVTVINGQDSSLSTIRLQLDALNTGAYEAGVRARIPMLATVLATARTGVVVETMWDSVEGPLGVVRLKILELLVVLLQYGSERTAAAIVDAKIPTTLVQLFARLEMNSLLQHMVATIVDLSFVSKSCERVRRAFLVEADLLQTCMAVWGVDAARNRTPGQTGSNRAADIVRMARAAEDFLRDTHSPEVQSVVAEVGSEQVERFARFCDVEVAGYLRLNVQLLGGAENLPRRLDDGFNSFDGLPYGGSGGQGALFFRPRGPPGAVGAT